jgi:tetratricopeptide (TPR) repeat protein
MRCPECGADLDADALFCPECGANPHLQPAARAGLGCRRFLPVLWAVLAVALALGLLAIAAWRGMVEGRNEWQGNAEATAEAELARCQTYLTEGNWALAAAACREADRLNPGAAGAREGWATAVAALTPEPTPTVEIVVRSSEDIFALAEERFSAQDWRGALEALNELWTLDAAFQADRVNEMRHASLVALANLALEDGRLEEAIFYLDQAAAFSALDPELETERQLAARYVSALNFCGVDWEECTSRLSALYTAYPTYRDVFEQLVTAHLEWAETMASIQEWCPAEVQYGEFLALRPDPNIEAKEADAAQRCLLATPTPIPGQITGTVTVTVEGFNVGRLAYSAYNADLGIYDLYVLSAYDQRLSKLASNAYQPNARRDGGLLVYRGVPGIQAIPPAGGGAVTLVDDPAAYWPTMSPDGSRVAYARQESDGWRIYVAPTDGSSEPQALVPGKYPLWGPNGVLAYSGCVVSNSARGVCVIDPNTPDANPVPLTADPNDVPTSWSPDGGNISYMSNHGGDWDVYLVSTSGGVALLTADDEAPASDGLPAWAPDGSAIAFISNREGKWELYLMSPNGTDVRKVLDIGPSHPNWTLDRLSWSP